MITAFAEKAWEDYLYWQSEDKKILKRINELIRDIGSALGPMAAATVLPWGGFVGIAWMVGLLYMLTLVFIAAPARFKA